IRVLGELVNGLLASSRPLSREQYHLVYRFYNDYHPKINAVASKNTCVKLLIDTRDLTFADFLALPDVIRLVEELSYAKYRKSRINHLNLRNKDRKFITSVIDHLLAADSCSVRPCYEKKKHWAGLLHHIHYMPKTDRGRELVNAMRGRGNRSIYAAFEREMAAGHIAEAVRILHDGKGSAEVLRHLNYIVSRCEASEDMEAVLSCMDTGNVIVLIQLLMRYGTPQLRLRRVFQFAKFNMLRIHRETDREMGHRRSHISVGQAGMLEKRIRAILEETLKDRLGRVYIDPDMDRYALPLQESTSQGGFGVLPVGSRLPINELMATEEEPAEAETTDYVEKAAGGEAPAGETDAGGSEKTADEPSLLDKISAVFTGKSGKPKRKKIRAFVYWEKVNDIDLSVMGINADGSQEEFSWRNMARKQSRGITFSGDQTSGYNGGSEYFDIDTLKIRDRHPDLRYLIFCANVFSTGVTFKECFCRAGYMIRDVRDSGQVYEPKTVRSAFTVDCDSRSVYLFGIDIIADCFVWLNISRDSQQRVAGLDNHAWLVKYFTLTDIINVGSFFRMMASECTESPEDAEIIVTDKEVAAPEGAEVIREYDFERIMELMNAREVPDHV
ncbi:MAG: hypothetical protein K6B72_12025, partial [Lachnospiraceae bacterium]|nr:hypothetical protein [Lachnospiraceae bacterium]